MAEKYKPNEIEAKWQAKWEADGLYHADIDPKQPKYYALTMLPYPSGDLHMGHWYAMTPSDAHARYMRMRGYNVMFPMGFDAFGLPAENAAIKRNIHPKEWTYANIENMRKQLRSMGAMFDWRREAISSDPEFYRWTQWFFLQLYKAGLAYRKMAAVDWCPKDNTTLAREQVIGEKRVCERCGTPVIKKNLEQWFFRITKYADELRLYDGIDWPETIRTLQTNWIGRSEGANVNFITETGEDFTIFTTRPDTLWGATFMVLAPEHPLVAKVTTDEKRAEVEAYVAEATRQTDVERESTEREKTGVFTGGYAINPVNNERIPIWIAGYVLMTYGTGAIMAVPAHDERDFEFARKFRLEVRPVIQPQDSEPLDGKTMTQAAPHYGAMVDSGPLTGTNADEAVKKTIAHLEKNNIGEGAVGYRIRDWLISRQRYWGAPIPMVYCKTCGVQPVPEDQLPVLLPDDIEWKPTGESPLKLHPIWKQTRCPNCDEPAERDTDTMDTFMCSSWYFLRYLSPHYDKAAFDPREYDYWMPVDVYTGGAEHAVMHLLYVRFFWKALRDMGIVEGHEPMLMLRNQGQILAGDHQRMSKSRGNVVDPDDLVREYGADTVRAYLMFGYRWAEGGPWGDENIQGVVRWLYRVWEMFSVKKGEGRREKGDLKALRRKVHQTIQSVTRDMEDFEFNTIVSSLMGLTNTMQDAKDAGAAGSEEWSEAQDVFLRLLAPVTPHIAEELWALQGKPYSVHTQSWPQADEKVAREDEITLVVQVNGKLRDRITVPVGISEADARERALASEAVQKQLTGKKPKQVIVVQGKLVNIVL
ncbi:MAG: leucine--tRNA ligase [Anaerolineales bacterium]